jgi:YHS domain-containing protein
LPSALVNLSEPRGCYDQRMSESAPERVIDPVCDMTVNVAEAAAKGLTLELEGRTYAFCAKRCLKDFAADPAKWIAKADATRPVAALGATPIIDEGLRRWYASCRCCMHDAYPEIVAALDAERTRSQQAVSGPGICEVAEGTVLGPP